MKPRIGIGCDYHRLVEGRKLILGGVEIIGEDLHLGTALAKECEGTTGPGSLFEYDFGVGNHIASSIELAIHRIEVG